MRSFINIQLFLLASFVLFLNIHESVAPEGGDDLGGRVSVDREGGRINIVDHVGGRVHEGEWAGGLKDIVDNGAPNQVPPHAQDTVASKNRVKAIAAEQAAKTKQAAKPADSIPEIATDSHLRKETKSGIAAGRQTPAAKEQEKA